MSYLLGALTLGAVVVPLTSGAAPSDLPPWSDPNDVPMPEDTQTVVIGKADLPIFSAPSTRAPRRGAAEWNGRLPFYGLKRGPGCAGRFVNVGPLAWICEDTVTLSTAPYDPHPTRTPIPDGLPFRYFFVGSGGSHGYQSLDDAEDVAPDQELESGFAVATVEERTKGGQPFVRTHHQFWVPRRDLIPVVATPFHGETVDGDDLAWGWVVEDRAPVFEKPDAHGKPVATRKRFDRVALTEEVRVRDQSLFRVSDVGWIRGRDVRRPTRAPRPPEVGAQERWIDVELASQTLVAYEGDRPVFATLVSTGRGAQGTELATPIGTHRIWIKLESSNMDNLEDEEAERYYAIEDVPYVQFFAKGVGLHGAFWHRSFGHARSHGCVNLAPLDAERLFGFTSPPLPSGWTAALPTPVQGGTVVRVR